MTNGGYDTPMPLIGSANGFSISIPQFYTGGAQTAAPAFGLNFDFGGNPAQIASNAYNFLANSFSTDKGFLNASIAGTQNFLSHQVAPILSADSLQIAQNAQQIPTLYKNILSIGKTSIAAINNNVAAGLQTESQTAQASIAASNAAANAGGGGCFITTAVCEFMGMADDCAMLQTFRRFRDEYMLPNFPQDVREYYRIAPSIVDALENSPRFEKYCGIMFDEYLLPCMTLIKHHHYALARDKYRELVKYARKVTGV